MRISGFLIGGILGAAAAMYLSRNKPVVLAEMNWDKAVDKIARAVQSAKAMWDTATVIRNAESKEADGANGKTGFSGQAAQAVLDGTGAKDKEEIGKLIRQDPEVSRQVEEILKENPGVSIQ